MGRATTDVNDGAASSSLLQVPRERLSEQEWSFYVRSHHCVPQLRRRRLQIAAREAGCRRVDEEVDGAELPHGSVHNYRRGGLVCQIDGSECRTRTCCPAPFAVDLVANLCGTRGIPARDENASRARCRALNRNAPAETTRPSGDNDHIALERPVSWLLGERWWRGL